MVSHIDDDHIAGLLQMMNKVKELEEAHEPVPWRVRRFWHNAFDDLLGNDEVGVGDDRLAGERRRARRPAASARGRTCWRASRRGASLAKVLKALGLEGNPPFGGLVRAAEVAGRARRPEADGGGAARLGA